MMRWGAAYVLGASALACGSGCGGQTEGELVPLVIAVSCNAATFVRDAQILLAGGYRLTRVTPVDQFRYSPHVEIVAQFTR